MRPRKKKKKNQHSWGGESVTGDRRWCTGEYNVGTGCNRGERAEKKIMLMQEVCLWKAVMGLNAWSHGEVAIIWSLYIVKRINSLCVTRQEWCSRPKWLLWHSTPIHFLHFFFLFICGRLRTVRRWGFTVAQWGTNQCVWKMELIVM